MKVEIITGIFSLVGVIIGAVIATGTQLYLEKRREVRTVQSAARLIEADLMIASAAVKLSLKKKVWWPDNIVLTTDGWQKYKDIIASKLPLNDWVTVIKAVQAINDIQQDRDVISKVQSEKSNISNSKNERAILATTNKLDSRSTDPLPALTKTSNKHIKMVIRDLNAGRAALAPLVGK